MPSNNSKYTPEIREQTLYQDNTWLKIVYYVIWQKINHAIKTHITSANIYFLISFGNYDGSIFHSLKDGFINLIERKHKKYEIHCHK